MTQRRRLELTVATVLGVGLAIAILSTLASPPLLPILAATALGILVLWIL